VPQPLGGAQALAVELNLARLAAREDDVGLERPVTDRSMQRDATCVGAEANQLRVASGARREALGPDMKRLEEVRLPGAVRAV
jgi:hypothetical protein